MMRTSIKFNISKLTKRGITVEIDELMGTIEFQKVPAATVLRETLEKKTLNSSVDSDALMAVLEILNQVELKELFEQMRESQIIL